MKKFYFFIMILSIACILASCVSYPSLTGVEMAKELAAGHREADMNPGRGDMEFDRFISLMGKAVGSGEYPQILEVVDKEISSYSGREAKRENAINYVWLNIFKGRVELAAGNYRSARKSFDEANRIYPPGLIGGPWRELTYGMSLAYWKTEAEKMLDRASDIYDDRGRFSDPGVMEHKDILFVKETGEAKLKETLKTYRDRGYAEAELGLIREYYNWITAR